MELSQNKESELKLSLNIEPNSRHMFIDNPDLILELETEAQKIQEIIRDTAESNIPKRKSLDRSKAWWSDNLTKLRREIGKAKKQWKRSPTQENHQTYLGARNSYFLEVKKSKSTCWNQFLEGAQGKEIFKAFSYTKQRCLQRLPILKYKVEDREKNIITFSNKYQAFLSTLF